MTTVSLTTSSSMVSNSTAVTNVTMADRQPDSASSCGSGSNQQTGASSMMMKQQRHHHNNNHNHHHLPDVISPTPPPPPLQLPSSTGPVLPLPSHDLRLPVNGILTTKSGTELIQLPPDASQCVIDEIYDSAAAGATNNNNNNSNNNYNNSNNNGDDNNSDENHHHHQQQDNESSASTESRYVVPPDGGWGWVVVAACFFICFIVDSVAYSYPMIYTNLTSSLNVEGPVAFFIGATLMALYMITAPFASALVNVYGTRRVIVLGSVLTSTGLIVSSRTVQSDSYWLILTFGVMGGVGLGMMYIGAMVSVGTYFDKRRPLALALAVCGSGLGMGVFPLVAHHLFDHFGLGPALQLYACFVLQGAWLGMLVWPLPPRPLYACAKPRRKDLLDRVTEWVDKLRRRSDSLDSLADPETIAERNKLVREAAQYRIEGLRRFESGLATPPTTPGSSLSLATTATPPASRNQSFNNNSSSNNNNQQQQVQFRRCTSIAITRQFSGEATATRSCPQLSSLVWTPHASHALIRQSDEPTTKQELHQRRRQTPCSSRSTSGVVCELADLGGSDQQPNSPPHQSFPNHNHISNCTNNYSNRPPPVVNRTTYRPAGDPMPHYRSQHPAVRGHLHHPRPHPGLATGTTVTSSSSDFAILAASKPMPLLSAGCCACVKKALEQSLDISLLRDSRFWILAIGNIAAMMGLYQIIFVLPALAVYADNNNSNNDDGDSQHNTSVIMAVFGVTHTIGRVFTGVMSGPRFRPLLLCNTAFVLSMAIFAVFAIAQEPLAYPVLCALAALHGLCYAVFAVLSTVIIVNVFGVRKLSSCFGMITLARGMAPYLTTLAYQLAYIIGTSNNNSPGNGDDASSFSSSDETSATGGDVSADSSLEQSANDLEVTRYVQRTYGIAGIIYVGLAFTFHLLLHFHYFKRRLLDVQRKPRPRLRCVSVPTPSSLSGYRLPNGGGRSLGDDDDEDGLQIVAEEVAARMSSLANNNNKTNNANNATTLEPPLQQIPSAILTPIDDDSNDNNNYYYNNNHDQQQQQQTTTNS